MSYLSFYVVYSVSYAQKSTVNIMFEPTGALKKYLDTLAILQNMVIKI